MGIRSFLVNQSINLALRMVSSIDDRDLQRLPLSGPAILISNHTSNVEGPLFYVRLRPRATIALAKAELWKFWATRMMMEAWDAVPVRRGRLDRLAISRCQKVLDTGNFLCLAPEGKRSKTGQLLRGQPGATWFALDKEIPIYPMVQWGCRDLVASLRRGKRARIHVRVGRPFVVRTPLGEKAHGEMLQAMADEMMYQMALLLPEQLRGVYRDTKLATTKYLYFLNETP